MTQYCSFFSSAFIESQTMEELNSFIRSHRVVHVTSLQGQTLT
jgi:hypothetical protein